MIDLLLDLLKPFLALGILGILYICIAAVWERVYKEFFEWRR